MSLFGLEFLVLGVVLIWLAGVSERIYPGALHDRDGVTIL
jgi:hypothetical protein